MNYVAKMIFFGSFETAEMKNLSAPPVSLTLASGPKFNLQLMPS